MPVAPALPPGPNREVALAVTCAIVIVSILFQGLTLKPVVRRLVNR